MLYEKKYFGNGTGNFDDVDFILLPNQWVNLENARIGSTDKGVIGTIESIGSNVLLSDVEPSVTFVQIGAVSDDANRRIFYFLKDLYGPWDKIICYDLENDIFYNVLFSAQVRKGLNFSKDNIIHSVQIINNLLYWTDNLNQPRRINVESAINLNHADTFPDAVAYTSPINAEVITIIRKPPAYPLTIEKLDSGDIPLTLNVNLIKNNAFRFTYRYTYRDGEISTLAEHSLLAPYNYKVETYDVIELTVPTTEIPDQDIQSIELIAIYLPDVVAFVIKTWNVDNPDDYTEIQDHITGGGNLTYYFTNTVVGEAISSEDLSKPYDTVPLISETLEQGVNRLFLGDNLLGYDTPAVSSLAASIYTADNSGDSVSGNWVDVTIEYTGNTQEDLDYFQAFVAYFPIAIDDTHPAGYYYSSGTSVPLPSTIDIADYDFVDSDFNAVVDYLASLYTPAFSPYSANLSTSDNAGSVSTGATPVTDNIQILKSDSSYRIGIVFYDKYMRQCGVVTTANNEATTPDRAYTFSTTYSYSIQWTLSNAAASDEIPDWAYYYGIVSSKSLRTSYFLQARTSEIVYATKDTDGNYVLTTLTYSASNAGVAVKLDLLDGIGFGYTYQAGDQIKIYIDGDTTVYTLAIIDTFSNYVIAELKDVGDLTSADAFFEIFTPLAAAAAENYYETGSLYSITEPTTTARRYSVLQGVLPSDIYLLTRSDTMDDYITENMSPNDSYYQNWLTSLGRIQIVDKIGQQYKRTSIKWSNTFIPGTITNGLSTFDSLDEKILPGELGNLRKLQITSKVNNELGAVMLGICEQETVSMYLGEQQLVGSAANAFIAQASDVIGTVNILKGSYGTLNPESICEFRGNVYWVDILNGKVIQYSLNGLFPISNYKMTRFWKQFSDQFLSMTAAEIEALGSRPFIFSTVDPHHWELLVTIPKLLETPPLGYLVDYPSIVYPFDIWDGQAKTLVFKINAEPNFWQGSYSYTSEGYITIQNRLFSFKYGQLYEHNMTDTYCNFYGVQYYSQIMFICNQQPERDKVYDNISIAANMVPTFTYFMSLSPYMQVSNLQDFDWERRESMLYCQIYRNVLTPSATGLQANALITGEKMRTYAFRVMLQFSVGSTPLELRFATLGYQISLGHTIPVQ